MSDDQQAKGAVQLRIRTRDAYVDVSETRPDGDDFDVSWKMYGPFATADEQRAFMHGLYEDVPAMSEEARARARASIDAWVRFDEEDGYEPPAAEPLAAAESAIVAPTEDEVRRYAQAQSETPDYAPETNGELIRFFVDGLRRVVN